MLFQAYLLASGVLMMHRYRGIPTVFKEIARAFRSRPAMRNQRQRASLMRDYGPGGPFVVTQGQRRVDCAALSRHHRELHRHDDEVTWWQQAGIDSTAAARALSIERHPLPTMSNAETRTQNTK
jgi:hypothetical protein